MTEASWVPGLVVLVLGLAAGVAVARWLVRRGPAEGAEQARDLELAVADLEARRDELYARLRDEAGELGEADRAALEEAAARTLRDLDRARARLPRGYRGRPPAAAPAGTARPRMVGRHPLLAGFLFGTALMALVGSLLYLAVRDARPEPKEASGEAVHPEGEALPPEVEARLAALRRQLASDPDDLAAHKEAALIELTHGRFVEAFGAAREVLRLRPEDADGLYVQGIVRLTMGQEEMALELLDGVLRQHPDHVRALLGRGLALARLGDLAGAIETWERGQELAGGENPDLERLIEMARQGLAAGPAPEMAVPGAPELPFPAASEQPYRLRIDLAPGFVAPAGSSLFVFLRAGISGPPVAVKRVASPRFPLEVGLGPEDSMLGQPLPPRGTLSVRLDLDGNASTRDPGDASAEEEVEAGGEVLRVVLGG